MTFGALELDEDRCVARWTEHDALELAQASRWPCVRCGDEHDGEGEVCAACDQGGFREEA